MPCAVRKEAEVRGPGSGRFLEQPPAGGRIYLFAGW